MGSRICEDDADDPRIGTDSTTLNDTAEGLAICKDGIVRRHQQRRSRAFRHGESGRLDAAPRPRRARTRLQQRDYDETGILRSSGTLPFDGRSDSARLRHQPTGRTCSASSTRAAVTTRAIARPFTRTQRCSAANNPVRAELINSWALYRRKRCHRWRHASAATAQDSPNRCTGFARRIAATTLRARPRVFLELLGLQLTRSNPALTGRMRCIPALGSTAPFRSHPRHPPLLRRR